jgi:hypothetical protein
METFVMKGVDKAEWGTGDANGNVTDWTQVQNLQPDSITRTKNNGTLAGFIPEDKDVALFTVYTPAENPGTITIGLAEQSPVNMQKLFNCIYDPATTSMVVLAKEKIANLAIRLTSRPVNGRRSVITYYNVDCLTGYSNNIAKAVNEALAITGTVKPYSYLGQDAIYTQQWVNEDGTPINSTPATVSAGAATQTTTATPKVLTGTATAAGGKTILSQYWSQVSGPNTATMATPTALSNSVGGLVTGVYVFKLTVVDSAGVETSATTQLTATIA